MENFEVQEKNKVRRAPHRAAYDRSTVFDILDASFVCHVGFAGPEGPFVIPMTYGRHHDTLYLHGATTSRLITLLENGPSVCVSVTLLDGLVMARSMFDSSVNYRSVVVFGRPELVPDADKVDALHIISDHMMPGRWEEVRPPLPKELKATAVIKLTIDTASAKVRTGPPSDSPADLHLPIWSGVVPLKLVAGQPLDDPTLTSEQPVPVSAHRLLEKYS